MEQVHADYSGGHRRQNEHIECGNQNRAYDTNMGLSDKEMQAKVAKSNGGTTPLGEAMSGGLEVHDFNCDISNRTTTPGKKAKDNDGDTTSGNTLAGNSFITTGGITTKATMKHRAIHNNLDK